MYRDIHTLQPYIIVIIVHYTFQSIICSAVQSQH